VDTVSGIIEQAYEDFLISLLVVDGSEQLAGHLQLHSSLTARFKIIAAKDSVEAIGIIEEHDVDILAIDGRSDDLDPLAVTTWALRFKPDLKLVFVTDDAVPAPSKIHCHSGGPVFLNAEDIGSQLGLVFDQDDCTVRPKTVTAIDALDVSRIAGIRGSSGAVRIFAAGASGTLRFEDGLLVHADCGAISGSDAFFSMMLWPRGDIERLSDEEAEGCESNVGFPSAFLFQEAERFRSALQGDDDGLEAEDAAVADEGEAEPDYAAVWRGLAQTYPSGVRVIVACSNRCEGSCFRKTLTEVGDALVADPPWLSESSDGPSFARVHPGAGGTLALTRVPLTRRHEYLFETLSKSAEITLLCGAESTGLVDGIKQRSSRTNVSTIGGDELTSTDLWRALRELADEGRVG
jgi:hypothetical protein